MNTFFCNGLGCGMCNRSAEACSAGFQPAVSPTSSRQCLQTFLTLADWKSAIQQTRSLRYLAVSSIPRSPE